MKKITFSVIVPIYNEETYLDKCIHSICSQSYGGLEIILVDDGSGISCAKKCDEYALKDKRIRVIHKQNGGLLSARKKGIEAATGEYVLFVDADDWIETELCQNLLEMAENKADMIAVSNYYRNYSDGEFLEVFHNSRKGIWRREEFETEVIPYFVKTDDYYDTEFPITMCFYSFKTEKAKETIQKWDERIRLSEDYVFVMLSILHADSIALIPYRAYHYRCNRKSMCYYIENAKEGWKYIYTFLNKEIKESSFHHKLLYKKNDFILFHSLMSTDYASVLKASNDFLFPFPDVKKGSRIIIYGAGTTGMKMYQAIQEQNEYTVIGFSDRNLNVSEECDVPFINPKDIRIVDYDYVVIAISYAHVRKEAGIELVALGVEEKKIAKLDSTLLDGRRIFKDMLTEYNQGS